MTLMIEREVKLRFDSPEEARAAILATGATPLRCRRLQEDALLDTEDETLRRRRCVLRIRTEAGKSLLTFKGPVQPGTMKVRDEYETVIGDGEVLQRVLRGARPARLVPLREVPRGVRRGRRDDCARRDAGRHLRRDRGRRAGHPVDDRALGRTPADFILDSYRGLFIKHREKFGLDVHMVFREE